MSDKHNFPINLEMQQVGPLPEITKILLFESVRELLFNAVKHSQASSARVHLRNADGLLQLIVIDEGVGFDPNEKPLADNSGNGLGLFSIRERLELIGGQFEIESAPGKGSRLVLTVPDTQAKAEKSVSQEAGNSLP